MLIFLDTEFTGFYKGAELLSLALVAEDAQELYLENLDYTPDKCSDFVNREVLPLMGKVAGAACSRPELAQRLTAWLADLSEPPTVVYDFEGDWDFFTGALPESAGLTSLIKEKILLENKVIRASFFKLGMIRTYSREWPEHHALADARALCNGYLTWREHRVARAKKGLHETQ